MSEPDLPAMTDEELSQLRRAVDAEVKRRHEQRTIPATMDRLNREYLRSEGRAEGEPWAQPQGAHDALPEGWTVTHEGKTWVSLIPANVWEPGVSGWREVAGDDGQPPEYSPPSGQHDSYNTGDQVTFEGDVYESLLDGNVWRPDQYPAGWKLIEGES